MFEKYRPKGGRRTKTLSRYDNTSSLQVRNNNDKSNLHGVRQIGDKIVTRGPYKGQTPLKFI